MGLLDDYQKQLEEDRLNENYDLENANPMTDEEYEAYKNEVDSIREQMREQESLKSTRVENKSYPNSEIGVKQEVQYNEHVYTMDELNVVENELSKIGLKLSLRTAKCPFCGADIISKAPTMVNPFTFETRTPYTCESCGSNFMTDRAYPQVVVTDENNNEIKVFFN